MEIWITEKALESSEFFNGIRITTCMGVSLRVVVYLNIAVWKRPSNLCQRGNKDVKPMMMMMMMISN
jgi:hypothetical protein